MSKTTKIILIILAVILIYIFSGYNSFITKQENYKNAFAQIETQYQRRFDLIPNLEASVKGVMNQEKEIFTSLAEARTRYSGAQTLSEKVGATAQLDGALSRLLVVMENYPTLKSSDVVRDLMTQIEGTENRISVERKRYNDTITDYNKSIKMFPSSIVAMIFNFDAEAYFESEKGSEKAPKINL